MPKKVCMFSKRKHLGRKHRKRKSINAAKSDLLTLDSRIIKKKVKKDIALYKKHLPMK